MNHNMRKMFSEQDIADIASKKIKKSLPQLDDILVKFDEDDTYLYIDFPKLIEKGYYPQNITCSVVDKGSGDKYYIFISFPSIYTDNSDITISSSDQDYPVTLDEFSYDELVLVVNSSEDAKLINFTYTKGLMEEI